MSVVTPRGFHLGKLEPRPFESLKFPSATPYLVGDCVQGASGYAAICVSAGTSGGSTPSFSSTPGNIVTDGGAAWQTVSLSHSSLAGGPGLYVLPGNADDNLQTMINSYGGSTAADLAVNVRIR